MCLTPPTHSFGNITSHLHSWLFSLFLFLLHSPCYYNRHVHCSLALTKGLLWEIVFGIKQLWRIATWFFWEFLFFFFLPFVIFLKEKREIIESLTASCFAPCPTRLLLSLRLCQWVDSLSRTVCCISICSDWDTIVWLCNTTCSFLTWTWWKNAVNC